MQHILTPHIKAAMKYAMVIIASAAAPPLLYRVGLLARVFLMDCFTIPTESMCPTLQPGDKVIANRLTLNTGGCAWGVCHRGDRVDCQGQKIHRVAE